MRWPTLILTALAALMMWGCGYKAPIEPPPGVFFADISAPLMQPESEDGIADLSDCQVHTTYVGIPIWGGLISVALDDAAIQAAIDDSGFDEVVYADYEWFNVLHVYSEFRVNVYGR